MTLSDTLHIRLEWFDGSDEGDAGQPYYVASCEEIVAVTDAPTWSELMHSIREMLAAAFEGEDLPTTYHLTPNPRIVITMELPQNYAEIA